MKTASQFLKEVDQVMVESLQQHITKDMSLIRKIEIAESIGIHSYKVVAAINECCENIDKQLVLAKFNEGDPVVASDDFEPAAKRHGKVISRGALEGTYKVKFENDEYDVPEHHLSRLDAVSEGSCGTSEEDDLKEETLTKEQETKREEIVMAMKKDKEELQKRYGDRWESVLYAIATKKALES